MFLLGMPENVDEIGNMKTIFKDIAYEDYQEGLYLVFRVYRFADLREADSSKKAAKVEFKRPYACAVLSLSSVVASEVSAVEGEVDRT